MNGQAVARINGRDEPAVMFRTTKRSLIAATSIAAVPGLLCVAGALSVHSELARSALSVMAAVCFAATGMLFALTLLTPGYIAIAQTGIHWPVLGGTTLVRWDTITELGIRTARGIRFLVLRTSRPPERRGLGPTLNRRHGELRDWDMGYPLSLMSNPDEFESMVKQRVGSMPSSGA